MADDTTPENGYGLLDDFVDDHRVENTNTSGEASDTPSDAPDPLPGLSSPTSDEPGDFDSTDQPEDETGPPPEEGEAGGNFDEPDFDPAFLKRGEAVGLSADDLARLDDMAAEVVLMREQNSGGGEGAGAGGEATTEEPAAAPLPFEPIKGKEGDTLESYAQRVNEQLAGLADYKVPVDQAYREELAQANQRYEQLVNYVEDMRARDEIREVDAAIATLGGADIYGEGDYFTVDDSFADARDKLIETAEDIAAGLQRRGRQVPGRRELLKRAHYQLHGETVQAQARTGYEGKARDRRGQFIATPTGSGSASDSKVSAPSYNKSNSLADDKSLLAWGN